MTSREVVKKAIQFQNPGRIPFDFPEKYGSDFYWANMEPSVDDRPGKGTDEWGAVWENIGVCNLGEVKDFPLKSWDDFEKLAIPDIKESRRWEKVKQARELAGDKFLLGVGVSLYERVHFIRGLANTWLDIYQAPERLGQLVDILVKMNEYAIERYAENDFDGYIFADDWGLQKRLMISPAKWREIWKPRYERVFAKAHAAGLLTFLHSCGYIVEILDDLIEIGLDVIQMDQQENMGLENLSRFKGKIAFWNPVDIQQTMVHGSEAEIREYCRKMVKKLGSAEGGFLAKWYSDPVGAGHREEAIEWMCDEFMRINKNWQNFWEIT